MTRERILHLTKSDFVRQTFRAGGPGGQKVDKTESGVRFIHEPSGARGESREERGQTQNERIAFRRMAESPRFKSWVKRYHDNYRLEPVEAIVARQMDERLMKIEVLNEDGEWVDADG